MSSKPETSGESAPTKQQTTELNIVAPDDWHLHLRDGDRLKSLLQIPLQCKRAIIMPNLRPPVTTTAMALDYKKRIVDNLPSDSNFQPLMTLYLTDQTTPEEIVKAKASGAVFACKLYPAGATTNSDSGVTDIKKIYPTLEQMAKSGILLLVHGEVRPSLVVTTIAVETFMRSMCACCVCLRRLSIQKSTSSTGNAYSSNVT